MKKKFLIRRFVALLALIAFMYVAFNFVIKLIFLAMYKGCEFVDVIIKGLL